VAVATWRGFASLTKETDGPGAFYAVVPAWLMITVGLVFGLAAGVLLFVGQVLYWRDNYRGALPWRHGRAWLSALRSAALLAAMRGGGDGCYYPEKGSPSHARRWLHSLTAYGFLLTFAATCAAAIYEHLLGRLPPYGFWTAPVLLGTIGGVMLCIGVGGLAYLKRSADKELGDERARALDYGFLVTLFLLGFTGLLLLLLRGTSAMPILLTVHLGVVGAFFLAMPYGKLVHATFRFSALLKDRLDLAADDQRRARQSDVLLPADPDAFDGNTA
jgi:citrate/tricarballylate utilization protein